MRYRLEGRGGVRHAAADRGSDVRGGLPGNPRVAGQRRQARRGRSVRVVMFFTAGDSSKSVVEEAGSASISARRRRKSSVRGGFGLFNVRESASISLAGTFLDPPGRAAGHAGPAHLIVPAVEAQVK